MKQAPEVTRSVKQVGVLDGANYHINPENVTHITQILRNMYSAPVLAVIREYAANAIDAHVEAGIPDRAIEVRLPTPLEPIFKVRDYGRGLTVEDTKSLLYGFGSSGAHKRESNDQIGGFGIGCKCAFAITDSFTYTIYRDGKKRVWSCFLDELDNGKASLQLEVDSKEPTGIEVAIPVSTDLVESFERYALTAFRFFRTKPKITGIEDENKILFGMPEPAATTELTLTAQSLTTGETEDWPVKIHFFRGLESHADDEEKALNPTGIVMGGIKYEFDIDACGILSDAKDDTTVALWKTLSDSLLIEAPIGWVQLAPNREALQYSKRTKAMFLATYKKLTVAHLMKVFDINNPSWSINSRFMRLVKLLQYASLPVKDVCQCIEDNSKLWRLMPSFGGALHAKETEFYLKMTGSYDPLGAKPTNSDLNWAVLGSVTITHERAYFWQSDGGYIDTTAERFSTKHLPFGNTSIMNSVFGAGVKKRPLIIGFITNEMANTLRPTTEMDEVKALAKKLCAKVYVDWRFAGLEHDVIRTSVAKFFTTEFQTDRMARGDGAHIMLVRVPSAADREAAIKKLELEPSDTVIYADGVIDKRPETAEVDMLAAITRRPSNRSYSRSSGPSQAISYSQHSAKWFTSIKSNQGNDSVASQNWDLVADVDTLVVSDDPEFKLPVITLDKFKVCAETLFSDSDLSRATSYEHDHFDGVHQRKLIAELSECGLWEVILKVKNIPAIRTGDVVKALGRIKNPLKAVTLGKALQDNILKPLLAKHPYAYEFIWQAGMQAGWTASNNGRGSARYNTTVYSEPEARKLNATFDALCRWCNSLDTTRLKTSDQFKAVVDQLSAYVDGRVNDWVIENVLDGRKDLLIPFQKLIVALTDARPTPISETELKRIMKANEEATLTILEECPQAWPFVLTDSQWHHKGGRWGNYPTILQMYCRKRFPNAAKDEEAHLLGIKKGSAFRDELIQQMTDSVMLPTTTNEESKGAN